MSSPSETLRLMKSKIGGRVGLLGGTFDPVHNGHLAVADAVRKGLGLNAVLFIPAAQPPHKKNYRISPLKDRMTMLELATAGRPELLVTGIEAERHGPSYSVDTLRLLHQLLGGEVRLFFIIGLDAFVDIVTWKEFAVLPRLADLVVLNRPSHDMAQMGRLINRFFPNFSYDPQKKAWIDQMGLALIYSFIMEPVTVSSTLVREEASRGRNMEGLVPSAVAEYIRSHDLYRGFGSVIE
jgi:nicotinate-nucleotide adenylyltransferase